MMLPRPVAIHFILRRWKTSSLSCLETGLDWDEHISQCRLIRWSNSHTRFCTDSQQSVKSACTGYTGKTQQRKAQRCHHANGVVSALHMCDGNSLACILGCTDCFWAGTRCAFDQWWCDGHLHECPITFDVRKPRCAPEKRLSDDHIYNVLQTVWSLLI